MEILKLKWRGHLIGELIDPLPDMWYLEGTWKSYETELAKEFETMVQSFNTKDVMFNPEKGTRVRFQEEGASEFLHALVISLDKNLLLVRRVFKEEAVDWLLNNVKE